jgi:myo-inositol-1(or 4)-monophosphatase
VEAALAAGAVLRQGFGAVREVRYKGVVDIVTEYDVRSEKTIARIVLDRFPTHQFLAEEGSTGGSDPRHRWIVDPLDGTTNYATGLPIYCVSIAYERDGRIEAGVIYDPTLDELFLATRGGGATLNGSPMRVSERDVLITCVLATGFPYDRSLYPRAMRLFEALSLRSRALRRLGSAAIDIAYVAAGRFDSYWESTIMPWDVAAGTLLVEEAGGRISDLAGQACGIERGEILVTNGVLHEEMVRQIAAAGG